MIHLDVLVLAECDAVEPVGKSEYSFYDLVKFEVRPKHLGVDIVFSQFQLVAVEPEVPRLHPEILSLGLACIFLNGFHLLNGGGLVSVDELVEQFVHAFPVAGHAAFEHVVGVSLVSKQLRNLASEVYEPFAYPAVVLAVAVACHGVLGHIHLSAQFSLGGICHEWVVAREVKREHPSFLFLLLCCLCGSLACRFWQSVELLLVGDVQLESLVFLQHVLRELQREHPGFLCQLSELFLALVVQQCTAAHQSLVCVFKQDLFLWREAAVVAVYVFDSLEKHRVESHIVGMLCQHGLYFLCQCVHLVVGFGAHEVVESR